MTWCNSLFYLFCCLLMLTSVKQARNVRSGCPIDLKYRAIFFLVGIEITTTVSHDFHHVSSAVELVTSVSDGSAGCSYCRYKRRPAVKTWLESVQSRKYLVITWRRSWKKSWVMSTRDGWRQNEERLLRFTWINHARRTRIENVFDFRLR